VNSPPRHKEHKGVGHQEERMTKEPGPFKILQKTLVDLGTLCALVVKLIKNNSIVFSVFLMPLSIMRRRGNREENNLENLEY
jgi:hypothetical protein